MNVIYNIEAHCRDDVLVRDFWVCVPVETTAMFKLPNYKLMAEGIEALEIWKDIRQGRIIWKIRIHQSGVPAVDQIYQCNSTGATLLGIAYDLANFKYILIQKEEDEDNVL